MYAERGSDGEDIGRTAAERLALAFVDRALPGETRPAALPESTDEEMAEEPAAAGRGR